jgi:carboxylate-amine ligase
MLTLGAEEEFFLVDADGQLSEHGPDVVDHTHSRDGELQRELTSSQVESASPVCHGAEELAAELTVLRNRLAASARKRGLRLLPSGTPVLAEQESSEITPTTRYRRLAAEFGPITDVGSACGCHVHVAVPDRESGVRVSNRVRGWLPVLLALTANSPLHFGADTRYSSWRHVLWSRWPSSGPPPVFASLDEYEQLVEDLLRSGAVLDRAMIYWDLRLSEKQPTLEFRVCDVAATADEAALVAALARALVSRALDDTSGLPPMPTEVLRANLWRVSRDGYQGSCLHPLSGKLTPVRQQLAQLVAAVEPALRAAGDLDFVRAGLAKLDESGDGARRQRDAFARRGRAADVVDMLAVSGGEI